MGYRILNIEDIDTVDWGNVNSNRDTVRKSLDGTKFVVKGSQVNDLTHEEILGIMRTPEWCMIVY